MNRGRRRGAFGGGDGRNAHREHRENVQYGDDGQGSEDRVPARRGRYSNAPPGRRQPIIGYKKLEELQGKDPSEIVSNLIGNPEGFKKVLQGSENGIRRDLMVLLIKVIAKATETHMRKNIISLFTCIKDTPFLTSHMPRFILEDLPDDRQIKEILESILKFFKSWLGCLPNSYTNIPLESLRFPVESMPDDEDAERIRVDLALTMSLRDEVIKSEKAKRNTTEDRSQAQLTPPNDFREMSVFPEPDDLRADKMPFLRKNLVEGGYNSVQDYLDVQFRLLREDFVGPLREGIHQVSEALGKRKKGRIPNIKVYYDVRILYPVCTKGGVVHRIQFDISDFKRVVWKHSKRLIFGSLLCLSKDNFKTFLLATVANRDEKDLSQGILDVYFHGGPKAVASVKDNDLFVMGESPAYFESYRHVLEGLKEIKEEEFPFTKYLVECKSNVNAPVYLRNGGGRYARYNLALTLGCQAAKSVPVLLKEAWPDENETSLNGSQLEALRAALSKELVVIQGPPGTGKTYVGLKIVRALLENQSVRDQDASESSPMLLVCYTNHALDQFLEGILDFCSDGVVRVGGRCNSEKVKPCNLNELSRNRPVDHIRDLSRAIAIAWRDIDAVKNKIDSLASGIERSEKGILDLDSIDEFLNRYHRIQFRQWAHYYPGVSIMDLWLGTYQAASSYQYFQSEVEQEEEEEEEEGANSINVVGESQILEDQRIIDGDEFEITSSLSSQSGQWRGGGGASAATAVTDGQWRGGGGASAATAVTEPQDQPGLAGSEAEGGWQVAGSKKKKKKIVQSSLKVAMRKPFSKEKVDQIFDIWYSDMNQRWGMYGYWLQKYKESLRIKLAEYGEEYETFCDKLKELRMQQEKMILRKAKVIGMTTTGAAKYRSVLQEIQPKIVVVEEAAEVLEAHILTSISPGTQHLILIGDHLQLRPNPNVYELARKYKLEVSLFERMVKNDMECIQLSTQHRMRPEIAQIMSHIYKGLKDHESVHRYLDVLGVNKNLFFIDHEEPETENTELRSPSNLHEATYLKALCNYFILQGYEPQQITILTMYTGQILALKKIMDKTNFEGVRVTAVDNFQGEENDIILLSLVRSNEEGKIGFLKIQNRICVALSRAKKGLYCIGNLSVLASQSDLWRRIVDDLHRKGRVGPALQLCCRNHPGNKLMASVAEHFNKAPEGGCSEPCEARLKCGHGCDRACHPTDQDHVQIKCRKECSKPLIGCIHRCKRLCHMGEECGDCKEPVLKTLPACGHMQPVACSKSVDSVTCQKKCEKTLGCGHRCANKCSDPCNEGECREKVRRDLPACQHNVSMECKEDEATFLCPIKCTATLECGHTCKGTCGECRQGRLHKPCGLTCKRTLICSHPCKQRCTKACPPCSRPCVVRCAHSKCKKKCGEVCVPCKERCVSGCQHSRCTNLCSEPCDNLVCNKPCPLQLKCGHPCIGLCGEDCPDLCRVCDKKKVTTVHFGEEDKPDARFIQLYDCKHIIEVSFMDEWMKEEDEDEATGRDVKLNCCPRCNTPIRFSCRYANVVKTSLQNIEKVKQKVLEEEKKRDRIGDRLRQKAIDLTEEFSDAEEVLEDLHLLQSRLALPLTLQQLRIIENQLTFLKKVYDFQKNFDLPYSGFASFSNYESTRLKYDEKMREELKSFRKVLMALDCSFGLLEQLSIDLQRISLLHNALKTQWEFFQEGKVDTSLDNIETDLNKKVTEDELDSLSKSLDSLRKRHRLTPLPTGRRVKILTTVDLSSGHWLCCRAGHVYCIAESADDDDSACRDCRLDDQTARQMQSFLSLY